MESLTAATNTAEEMTKVDNAPASVSEAMEMVQAGLSYLAAADAAQLADEAQAECLGELERADAVVTAARASFLSVFTIGKGYSADADYSARAWLMHRTGITRGAAAAHTAWAKRAATHPHVVAALAAGTLSESYGRTICQWTDRLPEKFRQESDELLAAAAAAGLDLRDLGAMFAEMYERARSELPDEDPDGDFEDRGVRLVTTFQGAGVLNADLTPECAAVVDAVLDALSAPAGAEDTRTREQRYHDALQEATTSVKDCILLCPFHHHVVIHRWGWTLVLNPDGTTTAWNKDKTKVLHSHGPPVRPG